mgnify:CR=1 FL=1
MGAKRLDWLWGREADKGADMAHRLHLVFGGELVSPQKTVFKDVSKIHIVGIFPDYASAQAAWKAEAQRTVDNAHMRYFIAHLHRLREDGALGDIADAMLGSEG